MSRKIKFRAWDEINEEMVYPRIIKESFTSISSGDLLNRYEIVMQFTGLKDKNGKEIYEGDIVKMGDNPDCWFSPRVVEFKNGSWMGRGCRIYTNQDKHDYQGDSNQDNWEIIGNIYENPELISEQS
jgi:uncharacterized phage protein (TIGR01671 family)